MEGREAQGKWVYQEEWVRREAGVVSEVDLQVFKDLMVVRDCQEYMETRASRVALGYMEGQG